MNLKIKSSLIIIVTLIIGFVLGIFFTKSFFPPIDMIERIAELRSPDGFMRRFERIIQPTESQREKIREILKSHFDRFHLRSKKFRDQFSSLNDSLIVELNPVLNENQKLRLEKMFKNMKEEGMRHFGQRPPHPERKMRFRDQKPK